MPIGDLLAQITGQPNSESENPFHDDFNLLKRKSNSQTQKPLSTAQGNSRPEGTRITVPPSKSATPKSSETKLSRDVSSGTNKEPLGSSNRKSVPDLQNRESKQPKKGSYAEIMARGKAAHAILGQVGKITHKNIERPPSKREREEKKTHMSLKKSKTSVSNENPLRSDHKKERYTGRVTPEPPKRIKKAALATTGYTGTARPKTSGLPRSSRMSGSGPIRKDLNERRSSTKPTKRYLSEDDEEEYSEENQHYESDLSDMEADAFEVDEEEEIAAKIARREDAEALAEENRLKREKEAKRKKLAAMAKSRSGRR